MKNTVTKIEIEEFLDKSLNFERMEEEEKAWGKSYHKIEEYIYTKGIKEGEVAKNYRAICLLEDNKFEFNTKLYVGSIHFYPDGTIYYINIDSFYLKREVDFGKDHNLYVGTDMKKELRERFLGKKLIDDDKNK